jgi:hypothetical protein
MICALHLTLLEQLSQGGWDVWIARVGEMNASYNCLRELEGKRMHGRSRRRCEDHIKFGFR